MHKSGTLRKSTLWKIHHGEIHFGKIHSVKNTQWKSTHWLKYTLEKKHIGNQNQKAVGESFQKIYDILWSLDRQIGNVKVLRTNQRTDLSRGRC